MVMTPVPALERRASRKTRRHRHLDIRRLFILPGVIFLGVFSFYPLVQLVRMAVSAVTSATLHGSWAFVGLDNLTKEISNGVLVDSIERTLIFVAIVTILGLVGGLAAAMALRSTGRIAGFLLGLMVFVWALPPVVNGSVWKFLLNSGGPVNSLVKATGLTNQALPFLFDSHWALYSVAVVNSWAVVPFNALVFRAALLNISKETFEAARLDGATPWQELRYLLLPAVRPTTLVLTVLTVVYAFRSFDYIYVMTFGGPGRATNTLPFLSYLQAFVQFDFGQGSATAVLTVLLVLILAVVYARSIRKEEAE